MNSNDPNVSPITSPKASYNERDLFISALMFYTRLPVPANAQHSQEILNRSRKYFPLVGLIVGAIGVITFLIVNTFFTIELSIALSMVVTILATGAFHEDGFADSCDGLGGGWGTEEVLTIMKDSRVGTYASVGLIAILSIKFLALSQLAELSIGTFISTLLISHVVSRQLSSSVIEQFSYVQDIDQSKVKPITATHLSEQDRNVSYLSTFIVVFVLMLSSQHISLFDSIVCVVLAFGVQQTFAHYVKKRIGGYTGDVLGAIQQLTEVSLYLSLLIVI